MIQTNTPPVPGRAVRALALLGAWLSAAAFVILTTVWIRLAHPAYRPLPAFGTPAFWQLAGLDALTASLLTFGPLLDKKKLNAARRQAPKPTTPQNRLRRGLAGAAFAGFILLQALAGNRGAPINWPGVLGGLAGLALLFVSMLRCIRLAPPPLPGDAANVEQVIRSAAALSPALFGTRPPNSYRADAGVRGVVYRRPPGQRVSMGIGGAVFTVMAALSLFLALLSAGLIAVPGWQMHEDIPVALMLGIGSVFFPLFVLSLAAMTGPCGLHFDLQTRTYAYRLSVPVRWPVLTGLAGRANRDELGLPWRTVEYSGTCDDMAGVQMLETTHKSTTTYSLFLRWKDPARPALRIGFTANEDKARALLAQAAGDFGVAVLPDADE